MLSTWANRETKASKAQLPHRHRREQVQSWRGDIYKQCIDCTYRLQSLCAPRMCAYATLPVVSTFFWWENLCTNITFNTPSIQALRFILQRRVLLNVVERCHTHGLVGQFAIGILLRMAANCAEGVRDCEWTILYLLGFRIISTDDLRLKADVATNTASESNDVVCAFCSEGKSVFTLKFLLGHA